MVAFWLVAVIFVFLIAAAIAFHVGIFLNRKSLLASIGAVCLFMIGAPLCPVGAMLILACSVWDIGHNTGFGLENGPTVFWAGLLALCSVVLYREHDWAFGLLDR